MPPQRGRLGQSSHYSIKVPPATNGIEDKFLIGPVAGEEEPCSIDSTDGLFDCRLVDVGEDLFEDLGDL